MLKVKGPWFIDEQGRRVLLRGVNLGGSTKIPMGFHPTEASLPPCQNHKPITFVGRPFPLSEAKEHFSRLSKWGFNLLRFLTTWEAIEHKGPGQYDEAYLDYLRAVVKMAGDFGFAVFIDPHQDAWSRFSGGDGAPAWTLDAAGFDLTKLDTSEAAITFSGRYPHYETMIWPNNWTRLASATMFTLFYGGKKFAPNCTVGQVHIQDFLQDHFLQAMVQVAERLHDLEHVLGYDSLNEPTPGYIGIQKLSAPLPVYNSAPKLTGLQSLSIPAGFTTDVPFVRRTGLEQAAEGFVTLNKDRVSAWKNPKDDLWRKHGVWDTDSKGNPVLLQDSYFANMSFFKDGVTPFALRYAAHLRKAHPHAILFIEGEPGSQEPLLWNSDVPVVNASHWYDLLTLITKQFNPEKCLVWGEEGGITGKDAVKSSFIKQIEAIKKVSERDLRGAPTLIGEFGLAYDLDGGNAYMDGDYSAHVEALSLYYDALDANLVHSAHWNYTADNTHEWGDNWNGEDLSIYTRSMPSADEDGGRAKEGFSRPTMRRCAGTPLKQTYSLSTKVFEFEMETDLQCNAPTLFYIPAHLSQNGEFKVEVSSGTTWFDATAQELAWERLESGIQNIQVNLS